MIRHIAFFLLLVHGVIHLLGFAKAFYIAETKLLTHPVGKPAGIIWMLTCFMLLFSAFLSVIGQELWWQSAAAGIFVSQCLILSSWRDAKYGTAINILLALIILATVFFPGL